MEKFDMRAITERKYRQQDKETEKQTLQKTGISKQKQGGEKQYDEQIIQNALGCGGERNSSLKKTHLGKCIKVYETVT